MSRGNEEAVPAGKLYTVITHLTMEAPPEQTRPPSPLPGIAITRRHDMPAADYLRLYRAVGDDWLWWNRLTLDEATLAAHIAAPETEIYVAEADDGAGDRAGGTPLGYVELDRRPAPDIDVRYLGVVPAHIGTGLGGRLLDHGLAAAWRHAPRRVILNTCTLDHPGALAFYQKHGFAVTHSEVDIVDDPRLVGLLPRTAAPHIPLAQPAQG